MTEHVVLSRATAYRAELERKEHVALLSLSAVRSERARVEQFLELYARFNAAPEPEPEEGAFVLTPDGWQHAEESSTNSEIGTSATTRGVSSDVVTPSSDESVTGREDVTAPLPATHSPETATASTAALKEVHDRKMGAEGAAAPEVAAIASPETLGQASPEPAGTQARPVEDIHAQAAVEGIQAGQENNTAPPVAEQMSQIRAAVERAPKPGTLKARVIQAFNEHPDWHATQIALHLGVDRGTVRVTARDAGITLRKMTSAERSELQSALNAHRRTPVLAHKARIAELYALHPEWHLADYAAEMKLSRVRISVLAHEAGIVIARPKAPPAPKPGSVRQETRAERVVAVLARHPDWTAPEVAQFLGLEAKHVRAVAKANGIEIKPVSDIGKALAGKAVVAPKVTTKVAPKVEEPLAFAGEADEAEADYVAPPLSSPTWQSGPNSKWFRLRRADGQWLHMSGHGFTADKNMGWIGRIGQLRTARSRFDDAKGLQIVGVAAVAK